MSRILVTWATTWGHTVQIAERVADRLREHGLDVTLARIEDLPPDALEHADAVVLAASVIYGKHQKAARTWARAHAGQLNSRPGAFLSVCGAIMANWADGPRFAAGYVEQFTRDTGWQPRLAVPVAGELAYLRYGFVTRMIMKGISRRTGRPTDTSRNHDLTDWAQLDRVADQIAAMVPVPAVV